jgi:hypothetical protein
MVTNGADRFPEGSTLHACGPDGCAALAKYWTEATYPARALIVSEDETDDDVFFILSGRARAATYTDRHLRGNRRPAALDQCDRHRGRPDCPHVGG